MLDIDVLCDPLQYDVTTGKYTLTFKPEREGESYSSYPATKHVALTGSEAVPTKVRMRWPVERLSVFNVISLSPVRDAHNVFNRTQMADWPEPRNADFNDNAKVLQEKTQADIVMAINEKPNRHVQSVTVVDKFVSYGVKYVVGEEFGESLVAQRSGFEFKGTIANDVPKKPE